MSQNPEAEVQHDDECGDQIRFGGCCKHYCPTGEHAVEKQPAPGYVEALEASLLFLDAAVRGLVTDPEYITCPRCRGYGEIPLGHPRSPEGYEFMECPVCQGTGEVTS